MLFDFWIPFWRHRFGHCLFAQQIVSSNENSLLSRCSTLRFRQPISLTGPVSFAWVLPEL